MESVILSFLVAVAAGVTVHMICKWFDNNHKHR